MWWDIFFNLWMWLVQKHTICTPCQKVCGVMLSTVLTTSACFPSCVLSVVAMWQRYQLHVLMLMSAMGQGFPPFSQLGRLLISTL